jgi:recombination protein RecA
MSTQDFAARLNKKLGAQLVVTADQIVIPRRYTTGSVAWDAILGGGLPGNQWTEIIGPESAGKTAAVLKMVAANQQEDGEFDVFWVAAEHFDTDQARALGVDLDRVTVLRTQLMEVALEAMVDALASKDFDCIILDSYPALSADEEVKKSMDEFTVGGGARLMNKFTRKAGVAGVRLADGSERPFVGIIINQWRDQIGGFSPMGTPKTTPGGKGKNYFYYCRVDITRGDWITEKRPGIKDPFKVGQVIRFNTIKNKSNAPQQKESVDFYFCGAPSLGFKRGDYDTLKELTDVAISAGVIDRAGAYYRFAGQQWQGKEGLTSALRDDTLLQMSIRRAIMEMSGEEKLEMMEG